MEAPQILPKNALFLSDRLRSFVPSTLPFEKRLARNSPQPAPMFGSNAISRQQNEPQPMLFSLSDYATGGAEVAFTVQGILKKIKGTRGDLYQREQVSSQMRSYLKEADWVDRM